MMINSIVNQPNITTILSSCDIQNKHNRITITETLPLSEIDLYL
jgi:hypothetical protein